MAAAAKVRLGRSSNVRSRSRWWGIATYVALFMLLIWTLVPLIWMFLASIKTNKEIYQQFTLWPRQVYFGHYVALTQGKFALWMRNSTIVSLVTTSVAIVLGSLAAYSLTRLRFTGRNVAARALVFTYLVPSSLLFIPLFQVMVRLNLGDTLTSLLLVYPTFSLPFCTWMLMSYFRSIPNELQEAALIDGCSPAGVLVRVVIPLSLPAIAVVALFAFTQSWNEFLYAFVFTTSTSTRTVTVGLMQMMGEDVFYWGQMMAGSLIAAIPSVTMYMAAQRFVIQGLTVGGVKG